MPPDEGSLRDRLTTLLLDWAEHIADAPALLTAMNWLALDRDLDQPPDAAGADPDSAEVRSLRERIIEQYAAPFNAVFDSPQAKTELGRVRPHHGNDSVDRTAGDRPTLDAARYRLPRECACCGGRVLVRLRQEKLRAAGYRPRELDSGWGRSAAVGWVRADRTCPPRSDRLCGCAAADDPGDYRLWTRRTPGRTTARRSTQHAWMLGWSNPGRIGARPEGPGTCRSAVSRMPRRRPAHSAFVRRNRSRIGKAFATRVSRGPGVSRTLRSIPVSAAATARTASRSMSSHRPEPRRGP